MKILWVTNIPIGKLEELTNTTVSSGSWMVALLKEMYNTKDIELIVATTWKFKKTKRIIDNNIIYILLPGGQPSKYNYKSKANLGIWEQVIKSFSPDLIHIWGSEYTHGLTALKAANNIPSVIYIQGLLGPIARYYYSGMSTKEILFSITLRDLLKNDSIKKQKTNFKNNAELEKKMFLLSGNIITENKWSTVYCKSINPNCTVYKSQLNIKEEFFIAKWDINMIELYSIMCPAPGYPLKGLHVLLNALKLVKRKYPNVKLNIPSMNSIYKLSILDRLKMTGYTKYIIKLIKQLDLKDNINFVGRLSSSQMAEMMSKVNVFVVPSALENHSSTLREAMIVGTPSISSYVGGVPEVVTNQYNGLLYRFEEYEMLAENICEIFESREMAIKLSENGRNSMRKNHDSGKIKDEIIGIYKNIINKR